VEKGLPVLTYPEALAEFFNQSKGIAVAGSHGKTTTSALLANTLADLGFSPSAVIGSKVSNWQSNSLAGESEIFVIEADEHQNKLRFYEPESIILNNIDYDHPDFYRTKEDYFCAFEDFVNRWSEKTQLSNFLIINQDDALCRRIFSALKNKKQIATFGKGKNTDFCLKKIVSRLKNGERFVSKITLKIKLKDKNLPCPSKNGLFVKFDSPLTGDHNAMNSVAVLAFIFNFILQLRQSGSQQNLAFNEELKAWFVRPLPSNISDQINWLKQLVGAIEKSLMTFLGTERRLQFKGRIKKTLVFDDFAHHPSEVEATLRAIKKTLPRHRLVVLFQPHTFSRTEKFLKEFANAFERADQVGVLEIYSSARESAGTVSSRDLVALIPEKEKAIYFSNQQEAIAHFSQLSFSRPTVFLTLGAGDGFRVGEELIKLKSS
jgi:UDP-N-acetylmuramate--alanine ligase